MPSMRAMTLIAGMLAAATGFAGNPCFAGNTGLADDSPDIAFSKRMFAGSARSRRAMPALSAVTTPRIWPSTRCRRSR